MAHQIVINEETGEKFETTSYLNVAAAVRLSGCNDIRTAWKRVLTGEQVAISAYKIEELGRHLKPYMEPALATAQAPQARRDWRDDPATQKQLDYLAVLRVQVNGPLTKGQASRMIEAAKQGDAALQYADGPTSIGEVY